MDPAIFDGLVSTAGVVGALAIAALTFVWREWRKEAASKDALYEAYVGKLLAVIEDYHDFAHALDRYVDAIEAQRASTRPASD